MVHVNSRNVVEYNAAKYYDKQLNNCRRADFTNFVATGNSLVHFQQNMIQLQDSVSKYNQHSKTVRLDTMVETICRRSLYSQIESI